MAIQAINTKLNLIPGGVIPVVNCSQYDVGRVLTFDIYDGNNAASLAAGTTVKVEGTKPSRHAFSYGSPTATISGNVVTISTADQMTAEAGTVECKIVLTNGSQVIGTAMFLLECEVAGVQDDVDISDTVLPTYMEAGRQNMLNAEAWAIGTKNGTAVSSDAPQYHNNSKWWCDQNQGKVEASQAWAETSHGYANQAQTAAANAQLFRDDSAKNAALSLNYADEGRKWSKSWAVYSDNTSEYGSDLNCSQFWSDRAQVFYNKASALYQLMQQRMNAWIAIMRQLIGSIYIATQSGDHLITQSGDNLVINFAGSVYLTTEADERLLTEVGNNIIVSK